MDAAITASRESDTAGIESPAPRDEIRDLGGKVSAGRFPNHWSKGQVGNKQVEVIDPFKVERLFPVLLAGIPEREDSLLIYDLTTERGERNEHMR